MMVRLNCSWIIDFEAVKVVVLRVFGATWRRNNKETFVVQLNVQAETVQELLRLVVVRRDMKHGAFVLDRYLGEVQMLASEFPEALIAMFLHQYPFLAIIGRRWDIDQLVFILTLQSVDKDPKAIKIINVAIHVLVIVWIATVEVPQVVDGQTFAELI